MDKTRPLFVYFRPFLNRMTNKVKKINLTAKMVFWDSTLGPGIGDADESTELWWPTKKFTFV